MSISVAFNSAHRVSLTSPFFLARRPVVDRNLDLVAHELLFCTAQSPVHGRLEEQAASAPVIADVCKHGLTRVTGDLRAILYIDAAALMSDIFDGLPHQRLILAISGIEQVDAASSARLEELAAAGFHFALVADRDSETVQRLLPSVEGVRIDAKAWNQPEGAARLAGLCAGFQAAGKRMLAENVDSAEAFLHCRNLGFDFFQGYFFARPSIEPGRTLSVSQMAVTELMGLIASDAESSDIEHRLKSDIALGLKLLRMANAPAFGTHRIDSLRQALMVVGRNQLQRWLRLMLYADATAEGRPVLPLLAMAATRGRLVELLGQKLRPGNRSIADAGFTVGIMSLMDALFCMPMEAILEQMPVADEVRAALLAREGYLGKLLSLAEYTEWAGDSKAQLNLLLTDLNMTCHELYAMQLAAFEWSDEVTRYARAG